MGSARICAMCRSSLVGRRVDGKRSFDVACEWRGDPFGWVGVRRLAGLRKKADFFKQDHL